MNNFFRNSNIFLTLENIFTNYFLRKKKIYFWFILPHSHSLFRMSCYISNCTSSGYLSGATSLLIRMSFLLKILFCLLFFFLFVALSLLLFFAAYRLFNCPSVQIPPLFKFPLFSNSPSIQIPPLFKFPLFSTAPSFQLPPLGRKLSPQYPHLSSDKMAATLKSPPLFLNSAVKATLCKK